VRPRTGPDTSANTAVLRRMQWRRGGQLPKVTQHDANAFLHYSRARANAVVDIKDAQSERYILLETTVRRQTSPRVSLLSVETAIASNAVFCSAATRKSIPGRMSDQSGWLPADHADAKDAGWCMLIAGCDALHVELRHQLWSSGR
jgi:hypothetical protein